MPQSHFPQCLDDESKSGDVYGGWPSVVTVKNCPGISIVVMQQVKIQGRQGQFPRSITKESAGHPPGICRPSPDAQQMPLWMFFPGGAMADHQVTTGHLQGIWGWPADIPPRNSDCFSCKNRVGIYKVYTGHPQGIWRWLADPSSRLIPCKNWPMPEKL